MIANSYRDLIDNLRLSRAVRAKTIELLHRLSQDDFDWRPRQSGNFLFGEKGGWSLGEHVDHTLRVETYLRERILEELIERARTGRRAELNFGVSDVNYSPSFIPNSFLRRAEGLFALGNRVGSVLVPRRVTEQLIRFSTFPVRTPKPWRPTHARNSGELLEELSTSLDAMEQLIEENKNGDFENMVFFHSILGRHTFSQLVRVISIHEEWHQDRMVEVLAKIPLHGSQST